MIPKPKAGGKKPSTMPDRLKFGAATAAANAGLVAHLCEECAKQVATYYARFRYFEEIERAEFVQGFMAAWHNLQPPAVPK